MNIKLLRRIQKVIVKRANQFNMNTWFSLMNIQARGVACGATACLAGWALTVASQTGHKKKFKPLLAAKSVVKSFGTDGVNLIGGSENIRMCKKGAEVLELNATQADRLFYLPNWPCALYDEYRAAQRQNAYQEMAKLASKRIDRFIESKGEV